MDSNVITVAAVAVSGLLTQFVTIYRDRQKRRVEVRNREWDVEDRRNKAQETVAALARVVDDTQAQTNQVLGAIQANTEISVNAFSAANSTNTKILKVHARIDALSATLTKIPTCQECKNFALSR